MDGICIRHDINRLSFHIALNSTHEVNIKTLLLSMRLISVRSGKTSTVFSLRSHGSTSPTIFFIYFKRCCDYRCLHLAIYLLKRLGLNWRMRNIGK